MKLLFKRQPLAIIFCFTLTLFIFSCSTSNEEDELNEIQPTESQLKITTVSEKELNALIQEENQTQLKTTETLRENIVVRFECERQNYTIYWTGNASLFGNNRPDPAAALRLREDIRRYFYRYNQLISVVQQNPQIDTEFWIFDTDDQEEGHPCHADNVVSTVANTPGISLTRGDDDED